MSFVRAELADFAGRLSVPLANAHGAIAERPSVVLTLTDAEGRAGRGECSPLAGHSRESLSDCREALKRWCATGEGTLPPAAACAVDCAQLDLRGQQRALPAYRLLFAGPLAPVAVSALVTGQTADAVVAEARRWVRDGFRTLKLKVATGLFATERATLQRVRDTVGPDIALRFDANRGFSPGEVGERLSALAGLAPEYVEEPASTWPQTWLDGSARPPVDVALDESLQEELDPRVLALARVGVLKPMLLGGPTACLALAEKLIAAGLDLVVTHSWDGPLGLACAAVTALALAAIYPGRLRACGLARHAGLLAWPSVDLPFLGVAALVPTELPGLGLLDWPSA